MSEPNVTSELTKIRNHPERAVPEETADILTQGMVAHVGFIEDDFPVVIPMSYHYSSATPERLYLHGSIRSRLLKHLASGAPVCVTVTLTDGLVYSRKAMNHSMNYRSAVVFGEAQEIVDEAQKFALFNQMVQRYFPGRTVDQDYHAPTSQDLGVTSMIEVTIKDWSGKARRGGPTAPEDDDPNALGSSGVIDLREV
jgi:nitroimidazol reductase NimA-like FMN-containing flavoprotein (pyridoxamine 5'-phosphate oxidase superfamily)